MRWRPLSSGPSVDAGDKITRGGPGGVFQRGDGTAGLIVTNGTDKFVMTCAHVMGPVGLLNPTMNDVYSPEYSQSCGVDCTKPFGTVEASTLDPLGPPVHRVQKISTIAGTTFAVDAALVKLGSGKTGSNKVSSIGLITGVRDLIAELGPASFGGATLIKASDGTALEVPVQKYGTTTKLTKGTVRRATTTATWIADAEGTGYVMEIDADPSANQKKSYTLDMKMTSGNTPYATTQDVLNAINTAGSPVTATISGTGNNPVLTVTGAQFSMPGDSGAPVVDGSNKIVGIVCSGSFIQIYEAGKSDSTDILTGQSQAVFIQAALSALNVSFAPDAPSAGDALIVPGMPIARALHLANHAVLARAEADLRTTPVGAQIVALARKHIAEIRELIHHRRSVTVAWHRMKGPGFVASLLRASTQPGWPIRSEIDGVTLVDAVRTVRGALSAAGSPMLRESLAAHGDEIVLLAAQAGSVDAVLAYLRARPTA